MKKLNINICSKAFITLSLCLSLTVAPSTAISQTPTLQEPNSSTNAVSRNQIIKFTDRGILPSSLRIKKEDSIVFFLNDTKDSLVSLEIDFADKATHCGGAKLQTGKNGKVSTSRPFGPNDFTSTCFHERGEYPFIVYGVPSNPQGLKSSVTVE
jgi:hypothetical protein